MNIVTFDEKSLSEVIPLTVNFQDRLQFSESITGATVTASVFSGTDPTPAAILSGAPTFASGAVTQVITGGVVGVIYSIVFIAAGSATHTYVKVGRLAVTADANSF